MDFVAWLSRLLFFALALWFALENTARVPVRLSSTLVWPEVPLIGLILACFGAGVLAGAIALAPTVFRLRRQLAVQARTERRVPERVDVSERLTEAARQVGAVGGLEADSRLDR